MGTYLVEEVMEYAGQLRLTLGERWGLAVLARDARDATRLTHHHANHPAILRHACVAPDAWRNVRTALVRKGVLEVVVQGRRGRGAMYRIPELATLVHPADAEAPMADVHGPASGPMAHPSGAESQINGAPEECGIERSIPHPTGAESGPIPHLSGAESAPAPFFPSSVPPPPVSGAVPPARVSGAGGAEEEGEASPENQHLERAMAIMESLRRLPLARESKRGQKVAREIARRLAVGRTEGELRDFMDRPLPPGGAWSVPAMLLARLDEIPARPPAVAPPRPPERGLAEVDEALGGTFARTGERPGAIDIAAVPGGWRARLQQRGELGDEG